MVVSWDLMVFNPLVKVYIAMDNHHEIAGQIHYFYDNFQ